MSFDQADVESLIKVLGSDWKVSKDITIGKLDLKKGDELQLDGATAGLTEPKQLLDLDDGVMFKFKRISAPTISTAGSTAGRIKSMKTTSFSTTLQDSDIEKLIKVLGPDWKITKEFLIGWSNTTLQVGDELVREGPTADLTDPKQLRDLPGGTMLKFKRVTYTYFDDSDSSSSSSSSSESSSSSSWSWSAPWSSAWAPGGFMAPSFPGPAPAPAPAFAPSAPSSFDAPLTSVRRLLFGGKFGRALPEQGYMGDNVQHKDMKTVASDWGQEFGPSSGQREFWEICADHPYNEWCRIHGYYRQAEAPRRLSSGAARKSVVLAAAALVLSSLHGLVSAGA